jgi:hypothetical protein
VSLKMSPIEYKDRHLQRLQATSLIAFHLLRRMG